MIEHKYPIDIQPTDLEPWLSPANVARIEPLPGWHNSIFRVDATEGAAYVLRVHVPEESLEYIEPTLEIARACSRDLSYVPAPVRTRSGEMHSAIRGRVATLWPYLDGISSEQVDANKRLEAARVLAEIHSVGTRISASGSIPLTWRFAEIDWQENRRWSHSRVRQFVSSSAKNAPGWLTDPEFGRELDSAVSAVAGELAGIEGTALTTSVAHGDFYAANLVFDPSDRIAGVIDWDDARIDWTGWDIANALLEFCAGPDGIGIDPALCVSFLDTYQDMGGTLSAAGRRHLPALIKARKLDEVMYSLDELARLGLVDWDYLGTSVASWRKLRSLDRV